MKFPSDEISELRYVSPEWIDNHTYINDPENSILGDNMWDLLKEWLDGNSKEI